MIKSNELRIGNWIKHSNENGAFLLSVKAISEKFVTVEHEGGSWMLPCEDFEPIPLTEDLLSKSPSFLKARNKYGPTFHVLKDEWK
ncbi:hypothetical protein M2459_001361 [Parabacteroides sp. PF5-5]|uniref:hypothetical protein n=1 Tax=unclassified Parabacteroides TaxID=2649774 RepID=UPI0024737D70|nr:MULTISPECIES: hypothetical protein [unclassified Parabacteroides]MDH6304626.1 hypothetical protein [Parabacteroides sp. PH5-39]MDH6315761.1 hypothetical protein [Parabacteroides sp. PF5-13]MDH6319420.1 hypothetical protein [Parabacteroides sp. PH5-13]MDH6323151.1 hypothetical protein [Parabacteroides sp. PH5-8]MDH6326953.1 hypothetical protein [Parabacteroides sp. PH5-41]